MDISLKSTASTMANDGLNRAATQPVRRSPCPEVQLQQSSSKITNPVVTSNAELDHAVSTANRTLCAVSSSLRFSLDEVSDRIVVKLVDDATNTVLKQFPTEQMLAIARDITNIQQGMLVSEKT
jgi:flagellar protein FlaG